MPDYTKQLPTTGNRIRLTNADEMGVRPVANTTGQNQLLINTLKLICSCFLNGLLIKP